MEQFRSRCQEEKKEEETVKMNKSKAEPVSSWCYPRKGSIKMRSLELDLHHARGVPGECGSARRSSKQGDRKRGPSSSPGRPSVDEEEDDNVGGVVS